MLNNSVVCCQPHGSFQNGVVGQADTKGGQMFMRGRQTRHSAGGLLGMSSERQMVFIHTIFPTACAIYVTIYKYCTFLNTEMHGLWTMDFTITLTNDIGNDGCS